MIKQIRDLAEFKEYYRIDLPANFEGGYLFLERWYTNVGHSTVGISRLTLEGGIEEYVVSCWLPGFDANQLRSDYSADLEDSMDSGWVAAANEEHALYLASSYFCLEIASHVHSMNEASHLSQAAFLEGCL